MGTEHAARAQRPVVESYIEVRNATESLAAPLSAEDQSVQSMPDASPTKWHRAHTTWFFETFVLLPHLEGYEPFHPAYELLFNSYYNSVGQQYPRPQRGFISRPGVEEIRGYRAQVDAAMKQLLSSTDDPTVLGLTELGLHHEQQHQELLLTDIKHALSKNPLDPVYLPESRESTMRLARNHPGATSARYVGFEGGRVRVGWEGEGFCYDNETPAHDVLIDDFELFSRPLTNRDVLAFIQSGGYRDPLLWLSDGWTWLEQCGRRLPAYWKCEEQLSGRESPTEAAQALSLFTLHGRMPLDLEETACHLTYFEADALARFYGARLPTEFEWEHAARTYLTRGGLPAAEPRFDPNHLRPGRASTTEPAGLAQLFGGVWEWTQSPYVPYPKYRPARGAVGEYNGKFMHNQMVLRGGSCVTPDGHLRESYRNFFPSSASFQFSGVRLVKEATP